MEKPCGRTMDPNKKYNLPRINGNQKAIRVKKALSDKDHPYAIFNLEQMRYAATVLSPNAYKVWSFLNANQDNYEFALSSKQFTGIMNQNTYRSGVNELIDKGFLRKAALYPNFEGYIFVEGGDNDDRTYMEETDLAFIDD